mgnify:FL=1
MNATITRSEETSSDFSPPGNYNIAEAFPVTDELVRRIRRNHRRELIHKIVSGPSLCCAALLIGGFAVAGIAHRR